MHRLIWQPCTPPLQRLDELCMQPWVPEEYLTHLRSVYEQKIEDYTRR